MRSAQNFEGLPAYAMALLGRNKSVLVIVIVSEKNTIVFGKLKEKQTLVRIWLVHVCLGMKELKILLPRNRIISLTSGIVFGKLN